MLDFVIIKIGVKYYSEELIDLYACGLLFIIIQSHVFLPAVSFFSAIKIQGFKFPIHPADEAIKRYTEEAEVKCATSDSCTFQSIIKDIPGHSRLDITMSCSLSQSQDEPPH